MTPAEQRIIDNRMRTEIAKLLAETTRPRAQEIWHPVLIAGALFACGAGALTLILVLMGII